MQELREFNDRMRNVMDDFLKIKFNIKKEISVEELMKIDVKTLIKKAREETITPPKIMIKDMPMQVDRLRLKDIVKNMADSRQISKKQLEEIQREKHRLEKMAEKAARESKLIGKNPFSVNKS